LFSYPDELLLKCDEPMIIKIRGRWLMKLEIMYHGMTNQFLEFGKEIPYCKVIENVCEVQDVVEFNMPSNS